MILEPLEKEDFIDIPFRDEYSSVFYFLHFEYLRVSGWLVTYSKEKLP